MLFLKSAFRYLSFLIFIFLSTFANSAYEGMTRDGDTAYFLFSAPNKIVRYDFKTENFLSEIPLDQVPTSFTASDGFLYIAYHREVRKISISGDSDEFVRNTNQGVDEILKTNAALYLFAGGNVTILDAQDYSLIASESPFYSGQSYNALGDGSAYFYRSTGVSPSDIHKVTLEENGALNRDIDSPYHGDYENASKLFINPSQNKVYDNAGIVYFAADLSYAGSLAGAFENLVFVDDTAIVNRESTLTIYSPTYIPSGQVDLLAIPNELAVYEDAVFAFSLEDLDVRVEKIDISSFSLPELGEPVDPNGLVYEPETVVNDGQDVTYAYDRENLSVFRWSSTTNTYLETYSLINPADWVTYHPGHKRLYLGYSDGRITYFDTQVSEAIETQLYALPSGVLGLESVEGYLFAVDGSGAWGSFYILNESGELLDSVEWQNSSRVYSWNEVSQRLYHFRDGTSPNDVEWIEIDPETGLFGIEGDSPFHGGNEITTSPPLSVSYDGQLVLTGGGELLDAYTLEVLNSLANDVSVAVWIQEKLVTIDSAGTAIEFWLDSYEKESSYRIASAQKIVAFEQNGHLLLVIETSTGLEFVEYDLDDLPDNDSDGINDLADNCAKVSNIEQLDFDNDLMGDACDSDDDNDSISDEVEIEVGLDPLNPEDAFGDLDFDGFDNRTEALLGSSIADATSVPSPLTEFLEDFENGSPAGFYTEQDALAWSVTSGGENSDQAFRSANIVNEDQVSSFSFTALFNQGVLSFSYQELGEYAYIYDLDIYIDNQRVYPSSVYSQTEWEGYDISVDSGIHTIRVEVSTDFLFGNGKPSYFLIDNFAFGADFDQDGVSDSNDNCPQQSNPRQYDLDEDGVGDVCDLDPENLDSDGDGYGDVLDNCPDIANSDQADIDNDYIGDACDPTDDRPADADGDGHYDYYDNCPNVQNEEQSDIDYDGAGDVCDSDADNDGIDNQIEAEFDFLDPLNPKDALLDEDGDGVSNYYEIINGHSPEVAEDYEAVNLLEYFPLGDLTRTYRDIDSYIEEKMVSIEGNRYLVSNQLGMEVEYELRDDGIYLVAERDGGGLSYIYENYLLFPKEMKLGQTLFLSPVTVSVIENDETLSVNVFDFSMTLTGFFQKDWKGESRESVVLLINYDDFFEQEKTYLKGLGSFESLDLELESFDMAEPVTNPITEVSTDSSGGGSSDVLLLMLMAGIFLMSLRRRMPKKY